MLKHSFLKARREILNIIYKTEHLLYLTNLFLCVGGQLCHCTDKENISGIIPISSLWIDMI